MRDARRARRHRHCDRHRAPFQGAAIGIGLHLWLEPWTSAACIACGAIAGLFVGHACGESVADGFAASAAIALAVLGVRAFLSVTRTFTRVPSSWTWFSR